MSLIEIESEVNARPLNYIEEMDSLPITPNQFHKNRRSTCAMPEQTVNLLATNSTSEKLTRREKERREYVSEM